MSEDIKMVVEKIEKEISRVECLCLEHELSGDKFYSGYVMGLREAMRILARGK
jgi:hypothetical protein